MNSKDQDFALALSNYRQMMDEGLRHTLKISRSVNKYLLKSLMILPKSIQAKQWFKNLTWTEKEQVVVFKQPKFGTMIYLSEQYVQIGYDPKDFEEDLPEVYVQQVAKRLVKDNARRVCRILAIALLNNKADLADSKKIDAIEEMFLWALNAQELAGLFVKYSQLENLPDFMSSIRLMAIQPQVGARELIEEQKPASQQKDVPEVLIRHMEG